MKYIKLLMFSMGVCGAQQLVAQTTDSTLPINTVVERVQKLFQVFPVEKLHLHFDKPYYAVGDTLWFNTYLSRNLAEYEPSKIAYVEVLNSRDSLIQTLRIPLDKGMGDGYLVLDPQYLKQENYRFRAYTKWMSNFSTDYFYNKVVPVGDVINKKLITDISFINNDQNAAKSQAVIQFRDAVGKLLVNSKVNWSLISGWETISNGKGETDGLGKLTVNLSAKERDILKKAFLEVSIQENRNEKPLTSSFSLKNSLWDADVQFFPEGGDLLAGISKNVAFKAVSAEGKGVPVKGRILDGKGKQVAEFSDLGLGMGYFHLLPLANEKYEAVVTFANGQEKKYKLPAVVQNKANVVYVKQDETNLNMAIVTSDEDYTKNPNQSYYVLVQSNGHLVYAAQANLKSSTALIVIPKERLPNGIAQVTLMTPDGKVVSERLTFVKSEKLLDINLAVNKEQFKAKEKVNLKLSVLNNGKKYPGRYSIAVIDESKVPYDDNQDLSIVSNFLVTSELKGYIENPNAYFDEKNPNRDQALDALLMTQGYRRFDYQDLIAEKLPTLTFMPEQGIELAGTLRLNTGRTVSNGGLLLSIPSRSIRKDAYTDDKGRFFFKDLVFADSSKVTVNARGNDNYRNMVINMDQSYFPEIDKDNAYKNNFVMNIDRAIAPYLENSKKEYRKSILLDEVAVVGVQKKVITNRDFPAISGLSMPEHRIEPERLAGCNVLTMCLSTLLTGITYDSQTQKYYVSRDYNSGGRVPVQFFLNGMAIDEPGLNSINVIDIEGIEIFLKDDLGTVSRMYQNNGVVSIYTKKIEAKKPRMSLAEIEKLLPKSNVIDLFPLGYIKERKFYTPTYETPESKAVNDLRTTVYWNPKVEVTETGETALDFYNADGNGRYKVIVEGMDDTGNIGRKVIYYEVRL
ncbi:carboxypeptidase regulatory-like domain-containing protein [Sphingobacterium faecium]|uniref:carboxypeptidase regulatory-like domain-containing protein n=1 Tax=Sphingobacterium faecium TaxID=34087 RepID=UPI00246908EE|nr:carboxypeptidase regulatory-like domain-containing protein [Sphingobacterium faecium]MDH5827668.1 carboxypeptidase regulatory-like domain-containing protein [Sphingobacterium faecium]